MIANFKCPKRYIVYKHTTPNGKIYIGITCQSASKRWGNGSGYKNNKYFYRAIKKYGWDNIMHEILITGLSKEEAEEKEIELISIYKSNDKKFGYNIENGGNSKGKCSEETKVKIGNANRGRKLSEERKQQIRLTQTGKILSAEQKSKIANSVKNTWNKNRREIYSKRFLGENNPNYNKTFTKEEIANLQNKNRGAKSPLSKKVGQFDLNGNLIKKFESVRDAGRNGFTTQAVSAVCRGEKHTHKNFIWKYLEE